MMTRVAIRQWLFSLSHRAADRRKKIARVMEKMMTRKQPDTMPRALTEHEKQELRREMAESSAWAKAELKRRRDAQERKNRK